MTARARALNARTLYLTKLWKNPNAFHDVEPWRVTRTYIVVGRARCALFKPAAGSGRAEIFVPHFSLWRRYQTGWTAPIFGQRDATPVRFSNAENPSILITHFLRRGAGLTGREERFLRSQKLASPPFIAIVETPAPRVRELFCVMNQCIAILRRPIRTNCIDDSRSRVQASCASDALD